MHRRALASVVALVGVACSPAVEKVQLLQSSQPRATPALSPEQIGASAKATRHFGVSVYQQVAPTKQNLLFSPHSIASGLLLAYAGARTETATEMRNVLELTSPDDEVHATAGALDLALRSRNVPDALRLDIVDALWGQAGKKFQSDFLDLLAIHYGAGIQLVDFGGNADGARRAINQWMGDHTNGAIEELLAPGTVTSSTRLVMTNAVYLDAWWADGFDPLYTEERPFATSTGTTVSVPTMLGASEKSSLYRDAGVTAVSLPYSGEAFSMVVICPDNLAGFEASFDDAALDRILDGLQPTPVKLRLPRWKIVDELALRPTLEALGMPSAFAGADFSGIDGTKGLRLDDIVHKTFAVVDERGTLAAAATGAVIVLTSGWGAAVEVNIDRAFLYLIRDNATGAVLFFGRVGDPTL